jgi:antitoxin component YwqK of YwqJK toxin-antitoxin module
MNVTLRAHTYVVKLLVLTAAALACAARNTSPEEVQTDGTLKLQKLDVTGRGKFDTWRWTRPTKDEEILVREDVDLNSDGKVDIRKMFVGEKISRIELDLDFDGKMDQIETYEDGLLTKTEISHGFSGHPNTWRFYEKGLLTRVERDTNGDRKPDEWLYYEQENLQRFARDYNFDGVVDNWE